jgi:hypothetical protein
MKPLPLLYMHIITRIRLMEDAPPRTKTLVPTAVVASLVVSGTASAGSLVVVASTTNY